MSPRKKTVAQDTPSKLSPWDVLALTQAAHDTVVKEQAVKAFELERQNMESQNQVLALRIKLMQDAAEKKLTEARLALEQSRVDASKLSAQLASRHQISWSTHGYNPDTGEIFAMES